MYNNKIIYSLLAIITFAAVIVAVQYRSYSARNFAADSTILTIDLPEKAYAIWQEKKVRGRILLLYDNYPHMGGRRYYEGVPQLTDLNLVEYAIFQNIIRRIYFMVPDADWEDFKQRKTITPIRQTPTMERGLYLFSMSGVPIIATTPSSLPRLSEKPLVYINKQNFNDKQVLEALSQKGISGDIIISFQEQKP